MLHYIMSILKKCRPLDVEKRNLTTNKEDEMQKYEKRILQRVLAEDITPMDLKKWLLFHLLKPEFISQIHMVLVYSNYEAIIVLKDNNVYSLGCLEGDLHMYPKKMKELCGKNIKTLAHGYFFILALTEEGEIYYWQSRKLDIGKPYIPIFIPTRIADLSKKCVVDIACGNYHFLALTSDQKVYAWGKNNYGQIGNKNTAIFNMPWQVKHNLENKNVVHIACGSTFNIVITDENKIYGWGNNNMGQISINQSQQYYMYPHEIITISDKIVKVTCGYDHTLALTNKGEIYAWGNNNYGQVGINKKLERFAPIVVNVPKMGKVLDIAAFGDLSVAAGHDRTIYIWGNFYSQRIFNPLPTKFLTIHDVFVYSDLKIMHKSLTLFTNNYKYVEEESNILESVGAAFDDALTSDFIIQVEGQSIYVHKFILNIRCKYFQKMFLRDWPENIQSKSASSSMFTVPDKFSYIVYKAFLKYLYTGAIDLPSEIVLELMELANMYCETNLIKDCSQIIKKAITISNVAFFYNKAIEYNAKELEVFCSQFALRHKTDDKLLGDINLDINMPDKIMHRRRHFYTDNIKWNLSQQFCFLGDVEERSLSVEFRKAYMRAYAFYGTQPETTITKKDEKYEKRNLQCILAERIILMDLKSWPFFRLLKPKFILQIHMVMIFHLHGDKAIIVTKDKNVYSLDYSKTDDIHTAIYPKKIKELCGKNIKTFAHSDSFILALTEKGEVYSCKVDDWPHGLRIPKESTFTKVPSLEKKYILDIACGHRHCLALTSDGKVYAWAENNCVQIDDGNIDIYDSEPRQVHKLKEKNVVHIACGSKFNVVITDENKIYGWGKNDKGQILIVESKKYYACPQEIITLSDKIVKVTCGYDHTLVLTNKGEIYAWGNNIYGQIGVKELKRSGPIMVNVPEMGKVLDIAAFADLSVAVGYDGIIYIWGNFYFERVFNQINIPFPTKFSTIHDVFAYSDLKIMHKPLIVFTDIEEVLNILESVEAAFDDSLTSDFIIQVEGQSIYVHKFILRIRCEYFKKMFHDWSKNIQSKSASSSMFTVPDKFSYIVYKAFLKYLYTSAIDLPSEIVLELMELANMYCETKLIKECSQIIKEAITVSNVTFFYNKAIECNVKELEKFCFQFALRHRCSTENI